MEVKRVALLGSTGSIGQSSLSIAEKSQGQVRIVALAAGAQADVLIEQAKRFQPEAVALADPDAAEQAAVALGPLGIQVFSGSEGVEKIAAWSSANMTLSAIVGAAGLRPTLAAIRAGKDIALANKECLVMAGALVLAEAKRHDVRILPVDSEHSALFQALDNPKWVRRLILTASGGPFRGWRREQLASVTPKQAVAHPNWSMGPKISVDSATMMNKGLEVIEARWLFDTPGDQIDVVIHPESIVHSLVEYVDGSSIAQMGAPDMRTPIAVALAWPDRLDFNPPLLDLAAIGRLTFYPPPERADFPCLGLAYDALVRGGTAPAILNAANEVAVAAFLDNRLPFLAIPRLIESVLGASAISELHRLDDVFQADERARRASETWIDRQDFAARGL